MFCLVCVCVCIWAQLWRLREELLQVSSLLLSYASKGLSSDLQTQLGSRYLLAQELHFKKESYMYVRCVYR